MEEVLLKKMEEDAVAGGLKLHRSRLDANTELKEQIQELPWDKRPVILIGGSFNSEKRATRVMKEGSEQIRELMEKLDPEENFFVIGHKVSGYEKYLVDHNEKNFRIFAIVPALISAEEKRRLLEAGVNIRVSTEIEGMGIYKSFNYEIFERRPSVVLGFDGNSAGANLIQEAKNGKGRAQILIWEKSATLREKAVSLEGYVRFFDKNHPLSELVAEAE
jgi:hypothetical protein